MLDNLLTKISHCNMNLVDCTNLNETFKNVLRILYAFSQPRRRLEKELKVVYVFSQIKEKLRLAAEILWSLKTHLGCLENPVNRTY